MSTSIERREARARAKLSAILRPGEQIVQETNAVTPVYIRAGANPMLLAVTDPRLLTCAIVEPHSAMGYSWGSMRDLQIRRKWWYVEVSFRVIVGGGAARSSFDHSYDIRKKGADPFLDALRSRWTARHPDHPIR